MVPAVFDYLFQLISASTVSVSLTSSSSLYPMADAKSEMFKFVVIRLDNEIYSYHPISETVMISILVLFQL